MTRSTTTRTAARLLAATATFAAVLAGAVPAGAASAATTTTTTVGTSPIPSAMTIAERMDRHRGVTMFEPRDEGPDTVVLGGLCTRLAEGGCEQMVATKDASIMVFRTAAEAELYTGHADDKAKALGRMVVSFGSPARVYVDLRDDYERKVKAFRATRPEVKNDASRAVRYVANHGLFMREPRFEDERGRRLGMASEFNGATQMVATDQADLIVFASRAAAEQYLSYADDVAFRYRRVVLSFGNPARVVGDLQVRYRTVFRAVIG